MSEFSSILSFYIHKKMLKPTLLLSIVALTAQICIKSLMEKGNRHP